MAKKHIALSLTCGLLLLAQSFCGGDATPQVSACDGLARDKCRDTAGCFLDYSGQPDGYSCRAAKNDCERATSSGGMSTCQAMSSCTWEPGSCYCPEGMLCFCGGGPPPTCRAK
jgi:hypothetical protein